MRIRRQDIRQRFQNIHRGGSLIGAIMGFIFAGIGVTVIIFLWGSPFDTFGSPPLFFRVFGSFIALAFVAVGSTAGIGALKALRGRAGNELPDDLENPERDDLAGPAGERGGGYACTRCGAPLASDADVSPRGDVKCKYCNSWFNIHEGSS